MPRQHISQEAVQTVGWPRARSLHARSMAKKKGGKKKGKKGKVEYLTTPDALAPFDLNVRDIVATPLGVECTVVGVRDGALWLKWPGGLISPATSAPQTVGDKAGLEAYGYHRRPQSAHIQRSIDEREQALYEHRRYGKPAPATAQFRLPIGPHGATGTQAFAAYAAESANPGSILRPATAPGKGAKKK